MAFTVNSIISIISSFSLRSTFSKVRTSVFLLLIALMYPENTMKSNCWQCDQSKRIVHVQKPQARAVPFGCVYIPPVSYDLDTPPPTLLLIKPMMAEFHTKWPSLPDTIVVKDKKTNVSCCNKSVMIPKEIKIRELLSKGGWTCWSCSLKLTRN